MGCLDIDTSEILTVDLIRIVLEFIMLTSIFFGNAFIIFAILRNWNRQSASIDNRGTTLLVIHLSVADLLVAVFNVYNLLPRYLCPFSEALKYMFVACILRFSLVLTAHLLSVYTLIAIAIDRYVIVLYPGQHERYINVRRAALFIGTMWVIACTWSSLLFHWNNWKIGEPCRINLVLPTAYVMVLCLSQVAFLVVASLVYWRIHRTALRIRQRTQQMSLAQKINMKSARGLIFIIGVYLFTWGPFVAIVILLGCGVHIPGEAFQILASFVNVNYLVNPYIYAYNTRSIRNAISGALKGLKLKTTVTFNNDPSSPTESTTNTNA